MRAILKCTEGKPDPTFGNIKHFIRQIDTQTDPDPARLIILKTLLREEQVRLVFQTPIKPY